MGSRAGGGGAYSAQGRDFDGTNDYATRGAELTGLADGKTGLVSAWYRVDGGDGTVRYLLNTGPTTAGKFWLYQNASNAIQVTGRNAAGTAILVLQSTAAYTAGATWLHILASWDLAAGTGLLYISDANAKAGAGTQTNEVIDYTEANFAVGGGTTGGSKLNGCLSEIWFNTEFLDISVEANRRKFISATGKPVSLGANGSTPTGNQPLIYMPAGDPSDNKGTGGNFTITGALDVASTSPSA